MLVSARYENDRSTGARGCGLRLRRDQQQRGRKPMTEDEMAGEIAQMRGEDDEYEERCQEIWSQTVKKPERTDNP